MKCLGKVDVEVPAHSRLLASLSLPKYKEIKAHFELGKDWYTPLSETNEAENSEKRCKDVYEQSKKKPQVLGKIKKSARFVNASIISEMLNRIWLYNGKIYTENRNDYSEEEVYLLILDCVDKEKIKFDKLKDKFKLE